MSRNYRREERDWRRQQPPSQEEERWSNGRSDDDFSMGLGQEEAPGRRPDQSDRGRYRDNQREYYSPEDYRGNERSLDGRSEGFQNSSRWQRSQFRPSEGDFAGASGEGQFAGRGPRNYKRSDERIEEDINERLTRHGMVDATDIEVSVQKGEVTLRGSVDSRQAKRIAEDIADSVSGVKDVVNQIRLKQSGENRNETEATGKQRKAG